MKLFKRKEDKKEIIIEIVELGLNINKTIYINQI